MVHTGRIQADPLETTAQEIKTAYAEVISSGSAFVCSGTCKAMSGFGEAPEAENTVLEGLDHG